MSNNDRFVNQSGLIDPDKLAKTRFLVIGAGAIGSFYTMTLAKMGAKDVTVIDYDKIEDHNIPNQMYPTYMTGKLKVDALKEICDMFAETKPYVRAARYDPTTEVDVDNYGVIVSCVDNMDVRKEIYDSCRGKVLGVLIEGRMGAQVFRAYCVKLGSKDERAYYEKELYPQSEATPDRCTQKSIIYTVLQVAGVMLSMTKRYLCEETVPTEVVYDCLNDTLSKKTFVRTNAQIIDASTDEPTESNELVKA